MTATCHSFQPERYCDAVTAEIERFAAVAHGVDPAQPVVTCPGWTFKDLLEHVGGVHRWAGNQVRVLTPERISSASMDLGIPDDPTALAAWVGAGAEDLLSALRGADPDAPMWAWGSDSHARFWPRRMLHETTVHRADAEISLGIAPSIDDAVAADGIDEYLDNLPHAAYFAPNVKELRGHGETLSLRTPDAAWTIRLEPDGFTWSHEDADGSATVTAPSPAMLLFMYGRRGGGSVTMEGDQNVLALWRENSSI